jgi:hypothetical protein
MKNMFHALANGSRGRLARWGVGVTLAGFLAGGGFAAAAAVGGNAPAASPAGSTTSATASQLSANTTELNTLLTASGSTATKVSGRALRRLRALGGMYGSFTFRTKAGDRTLAFERGTIEQVSSSEIVVRAADGTTMTWLFVSDTVVRDHGKATTAALQDGQLVFVGGPVVSGAKDARLIVVRTGGSATAPASRAPRSSPTASTSVS